MGVEDLERDQFLVMVALIADACETNAVFGEAESELYQIGGHPQDFVVDLRRWPKLADDAWHNRPDVKQPVSYEVVPDLGRLLRPLSDP